MKTTFTCKVCKKTAKIPIDINESILKKRWLQTNPKLCYKCIRELSDKLISLQQDYTNQLESVDISELGNIAEELQQEFRSTLKQYKIQDALDLEDILNQ